MNWFKNRNDKKDSLARSREERIKQRISREEASSPAFQNQPAPGGGFQGPEQLRSQLEITMSSPSSRGVAAKLYLDNFKYLNKLFGYDYCEKLLAQIGAYFQEISEGHVYRYVGVEYVMLLEQYTEGQARQLAETILQRFSRVWTIEGIDCLCTLQIGLCSYRGQSLSPQELLKRLDLALSASEEAGSNELAFYDMDIHNQFLRSQAIATYLQTAIDRNEIQVHYRPTFNTRSGRFTRADFSMRVFIQGIGMVGSSEIMPIAEESGQIRSISSCCLEQAGRCIQSLVQKGREFDSICVEISPMFLLQENFLDQIQGVLDAFRIPSGKLALELNQGILGAAYLNAGVVMQELSRMGVELVLNSFGSGSMPVSSILDLPVQTLKLDRMFVWQLETNPQAASLMGGLIQIGDSLDLHMIAEGVETERQLQALNRYGCEFQQGFYYAPSVEQQVLERILGASLEKSRMILEQEKMKIHQ